MPIAVDPMALQEASSAVTSAITECESVIAQLNAAKASMESSITATISATNTALAGWTQGAGQSAFEGAQAKLRSHMTAFDGQLPGILSVAQALNQSLLEYQAALGASGNVFGETDSQIAASWSAVQ